ncbi:MAG: hypothetical protein EBU85_08225, partial [Actinobacteria bacterium]|nr:hypothetical protein [Actinomycetota bacterium]
DAKGDGIWPNAEQGIQAPPRSVTGLSNEEARDVLGMAVSHLQMPVEPDWSDPVTVAALRARFLVVVVDHREKLWERVLTQCKELDATDWQQMPTSVLSSETLDWLADLAKTAGAQTVSLALRKHLLDGAREAAKDGTPKSLRAMIFGLTDFADLEGMAGDLDGALLKYQEALEIARVLAASLGTHESLRDVSIALERVGHIEEAKGDLYGALLTFREVLGIRRAIVQVERTSERLRDLSISLCRTANVERALGDNDKALKKYAESLDINGCVAEELGTPEILVEMSNSLERIAHIDRDRGDLGAALAKLQSVLTARRGLVDALGTPESKRGLSLALHGI